MRFRGSAISPDETATWIFPGRSDGSPISGEPPARQQQGSSTQRAPGPTFLDDAEKMPLAWRCDREEREDQPREKEGAPVQLGLRLFPGQMRVASPFVARSEVWRPHRLFSPAHRRCWLASGLVACFDTCTCRLRDLLLRDAEYHAAGDIRRYPDHHQGCCDLVCSLRRGLGLLKLEYP